MINLVMLVLILTVAAVVMVALVAQHGVEYLFATVVLMGLIQLVVGFMHTSY